MNKFLTLTSTTTLLLGAFLVASCSGGGGSSSDDGGGGGNIGSTGSTEPASITGNNAEALGIDATEAATKAIEADSADVSLPFGASITGTISPSQLAQDINQHILESLQGSNLPLGFTMTGSDFADFPGFCGGSITVPDSWQNGGSLDGTITYNNFCMDIGDTIYGQVTVNGSITMSGDTITYGNLTMSFGNGAVYTCNGSASSITSCTTNTVYTGSNGSSYSISDANVYGNEFDGYNVNAEYCNTSYGCLTIETPEPIMFDCSNGNPSTGSIIFTSDNGSNGSITFDSCDSYTITYSTSSGGAINTISGTW